MERRLCLAALLRALPLMLRRPPSRSESRRREDTIWPPHRPALTNISTRSDHADCSMFFPLSPLRQPPQALSSNPMHVAPFFLSVFLVPPRPSCVDSFVRVLLVHPPNRTSPELSPSFVALVKSSLAPFYFPSLVLFPCLAAVLACVQCVCLYL
jgi:hypothetical protein